jgi:hypothetical protein
VKQFWIARIIWNDKILWAGTAANRDLIEQLVQRAQEVIGLALCEILDTGALAFEVVVENIVCEQVKEGVPHGQPIN